MNKKGMTLIELMAVIAILAILTLMIAPDILDIRTRSMKSTLSSKVTRIENAAIKYASDNIVNIPSKFTNSNLKYPQYKQINGQWDYYDSDNKLDKCLDEKPDTDACNQFCLIVYVNSLIQNGYLAGDDETKTSIIHPLTGESLNDRKVCVRYDTDKVVIGKTGAGALKEESDYVRNRKIIAYVIDEGDLYNEFN